MPLYALVMSCLPRQCDLITYKLILSTILKRDTAADHPRGDRACGLALPVGASASKTPPRKSRQSAVDNSVREPTRVPSELLLHHLSSGSGLSCSGRVPDLLIVATPSASQELAIGDDRFCRAVPARGSCLPTPVRSTTRKLHKGTCTRQYRVVPPSRAAAPVEPRAPKRNDAHRIVLRGGSSPRWPARRRTRAGSMGPRRRCRTCSAVEGGALGSRDGAYCLACRREDNADARRHESRAITARRRLRRHPQVDVPRPSLRACGLASGRPPICLRASRRHP
jgi:hypothetical protein